MKRIAIVTGASSGMGRDFAITVPQNVKVDEIWVIARTKEKLEELKKIIEIPIKVVDMDISIDENTNKLKSLLEKEKVSIELLINAAGYGKFDKVENLSYEDNMGMIDLNIRALTKMCIICIPFMHKGSKILNISSLAAFQPVPYMNIYAASKIYVLHFTRALNRELKSKGIHVMALCPYWTKTGFFDRAVTKNDVVKKYIVMYKSEDMVIRAWRDLKREKDMSSFGFMSKIQILFCKLMPHRAIMNMWLRQQDLK